LFPENSVKELRSSTRWTQWKTRAPEFPLARQARGNVDPNGDELSADRVIGLTYIEGVVLQDRYKIVLY